MKAHNIDNSLARLRVVNKDPEDELHKGKVNDKQYFAPQESKKDVPWKSGGLGCYT